MSSSVKSAKLRNKKRKTTFFSTFRLVLVVSCLIYSPLVSEQLGTVRLASLAVEIFAESFPTLVFQP